VIVSLDFTTIQPITLVNHVTIHVRLAVLMGLILVRHVTLQDLIKFSQMVHVSVILDILKSLIP